MRNVTDEFVKFALEYADYDKIPAEVIHESKRVLLDGLGNALGGIASDKGKIGIMFARRQGGNGAASLIGVGGKSSAAVAAFCNAELWNGLDMDPVPHVPPIVIPAILAVAEERGSTGTKGISQRCGVIDSGFRNEWFIPLTNLNTKPLALVKPGKEHLLDGQDVVLYPVSKAICQAVLLPVPRTEVVELSPDEIRAMESQRGEGELGSSGK